MPGAGAGSAAGERVRQRGDRAGALLHARRAGGGRGPARYLIVTIPPTQADKLPPLRELVADYGVRRIKTAD
jgi:hypothetical protein